MKRVQDAKWGSGAGLPGWSRRAVLKAGAVGAAMSVAPAFIRNVGASTPRKVKFLLVAPPVRHPMLLERKADAMTGYLVSDGAVLLGQGAELEILPYADYGFRLLDLGLLTQSKRVREDPKLCADFVEGAMKGLRMQLVEPRVAADLTLQTLKEFQGAPAAPAIIEHGLEISNALSAVPAVEKGGLGAMDPEDWATTVDIVTKYMGLPKAVDPASVYTNKFAGTEKLTPQEWAAVKARVRKFIRV